MMKATILPGVPVGAEHRVERETSAVRFEGAEVRLGGRVIWSDVTLGFLVSS